MALKSCPECGHQVSDLAAACPSCGAPVTGARSQGSSGPGHDTWGKVALGMGAWLISPWIARTIAVVVFAIVAVVLFSQGRG